MLSFAAIILAVGVTPYTCAADIPVHASRIGPMYLGASMPAAVQNYNYRAEAFEDDGEGGTRYVVAICGHVEIVAETFGRGDKVGRLTADSPIFVTSAGSRVGMTVAELRSHHRRGRVYIGEEEGGYAVFNSGEGPIFALDETAIPRRCYNYGVKCDALLNGVKSVRVFLALDPR